MSAVNLSTEFVRVFLAASNPFRESIIYTPSGGSPVSIYCVVRRGGIGKTQNKAERANAAYNYTIDIATDSTNGIEKVTISKDKVTINAPEFGEDNTFRVAGIIGKTPMCWRLGLRA